MVKIHTKRTVDCFVFSACVLLLLTAGAKLCSVGLSGSGLLKEPDPITGLALGHLLVVVGLLEVGVAVACLRTSRRRLAVGMIAWLGLSFATYRLELWFIGWQRPCACLGTLFQPLGISPVVIDRVMLLSLGYLLIGSLVSSCLLGTVPSPPAPEDTRRPSELLSGLTMRFLERLRHARRAIIGCRRWHRLLVIFLPLSYAPAQAAAGYDVVGYLTYTIYSEAERPVQKDVLLFTARVAPPQWRVRIEPAIMRKTTIAFDEAVLTTNDSVMIVTGFDSALAASPSPPAIQDLRDQLNRTQPKEIASITTPPDIQQLYSNFLAFNKLSLPMPSPATPDPTNHINNAAVARIMRGPDPFAGPGHIALIVFAFTPPRSLSNGPKRLLVQPWDSGSSARARYLQCLWSQFTNAPHLVASADYSRAGRESLFSGEVRTIDTSVDGNSLDVAARYIVTHATNCGEFTLPVAFELTRFLPSPRKDAQPKVGSRVRGTVTAMSRFEADVPLELPFPGITVVTDYRLSSGALHGTPLTYVVHSNGPPGITLLKQGALYKRTLAVVRLSTRSTHGRISLLLLLLLSPLCVLLLWRRRSKRGIMVGNQS